MAMPAAGDQQGEAVAGATQLIEDGLAFVPLVTARRRRARRGLHDLRDLRHAFVDARKRIGLVVDDDENLQLVELHDTFGE
jgi:hypothetical protein